MKFSLSRREVILAVATGSVVLFGASVFLVRPKIGVWKQISAEERVIADRIKQDEMLLREKGKWENEFAELRKLLPQHPADKTVDVFWLSTMDNMAGRRGVKILRRQASEEKVMGDVYELPIECKDWEGTLESLVRFLFDLQSEGAMLDIRQLSVKPKPDGGLKGRFWLYCAYTRAQS